jgi:asparagine synthase (glutamine-hydrolysing)
MGPALVYDHLRRRSALAGLATRHPIADVDLLETVLALPPELAFHPRHGRPLLREAVAGLLPDEVRLRAAKSDFNAPFHAGLAGPDLPLVRRLLGGRDARIGAYVDRAALARDLLGAVPAGGGELQDWGLYTWRLVTAEMWLRMQDGVQAQTALRQEVEVLPMDVEICERR